MSHELRRRTFEASFRMSKTDLRARPLFARKREAIEAHLTVVFTALAVSRVIQERTGLAIRNVIRQLRPLRSATIAINGTQQRFDPDIPADKQAILNAIASEKFTHQANEPTRVGLPDATFTVRLIGTDKGAHARRFAGSPAFVVDGRDLFDRGDGHGSMACRMYLTPDGPSNLPAFQDLRAALKRRTEAA